MIAVHIPGGKEILDQSDVIRNIDRTPKELLELILHVASRLNYAVKEEEVLEEIRSNHELLDKIVFEILKLSAL